MGTALLVRTIAMDDGPAAVDGRGPGLRTTGSPSSSSHTARFTVMARHPGILRM